ncbi:ergothioneine biosynthesis protein EgtB [uncultured Shewanella sp.]|uniref:ergothioneine biosynthesis protein EgtB n=1 Tax=uncultured Shewanella sp. TaxID=173975 RepID=UPI00262C0C57|nr:ergothioneine biosynthesis protein EgtB [uncultured Shewanella sp.]
MTKISTLKPLFIDTRQHSLLACNLLTLEDMGIQAATFVSPPKWHLAHTTWFFETFILKEFTDNYVAFNATYEHLFNSYYNGIGKQYPRSQRGLLSRPSIDEVLTYREVIDTAIINLICDIHHPKHQIILKRCMLGIQHEKQHQELLYTDIKYSLSHNPLYPTLMTDLPAAPPQYAQHWLPFQGGLYQIGVDPDELPFSFDNESPKHHTYLSDFSLSNRLVTNKEFQSFIDDGGYERPELWLSDGWDHRQKNQWQQPLYWLSIEGEALQYTLYGLQKRHDDQAVIHISAFEADAYANWADARLPTEAEWEHAANQHAALVDLNDTCWQWTSSPYRPYPGFKAAKGAIGEYNGKFMCNQWVLKGGSPVSPNNHLRPSYRNFFYPDQRWQFSGIRLAK